MATPVIPYLESNFQRARPILFTGAGFSLDAKNIRGEPMSGATRLRDELWRLCFPGTTPDADTSLQNIFETAQLQHSAPLKPLLTDLLTIESTSLPPWYQAISHCRGTAATR